MKTEEKIKKYLNEETAFDVAKTIFDKVASMEQRLRAAGGDKEKVAKDVLDFAKKEVGKARLLPSQKKNIINTIQNML